MSAENMEALLQQALIDIENLSEVLQGERKALEARDSEALDARVNEKVELLQAMEDNARQRQALVTAAGFKGNKESYLDYFNSLDQASAETCQKTFFVLEEKLQLCQEQNSINGVIVHRSQQNTKQVLNILKGQDGPAELYDNKGHRETDLSQRPIAKV